MHEVPAQEHSSKVSQGSQRQTAVLVTGSGGELAHGLIRALAAHEENLSIVALDKRPPDGVTSEFCSETITGDVRDLDMLEELSERYAFNRVYHLAAMLSSSAEHAPIRAYEVNVGGTMNLLRLAVAESTRTGVDPMVLFPSTVAVYGLPSFKDKQAAGSVHEDEWLDPRTMYGCNKLAAEHLGRYFTNHHRQFEEEKSGTIDFRALRFPGLISADTLPTGGTTDYGPEMLHAAAQGEFYECFVREETQLPFMTMPEAIHALLELGAAERSSLTRTAYNVRSFAPSVLELHTVIREHFPSLQVGFDPHPGRQMIVDGWPGDTDDSAACRDWGWAPHHSLESAMADYLVPTVTTRYAGT